MKETQHKASPAIIAITLGWSCIYGIYITFVSLLIMGPRDFNGDPNPLSTNITGGLFLLAGIGQAILAISLTKRQTVRPLQLALLVAASSCIVGVISVGHNFISAINPLFINLAVLLLLFAVQHALIRRKS